VPALNQFDYFTDIEETFIKRRGKHLMIGPLDWALIESWQQRGIPLRIVLRAIDEVFDSIEQRAESTMNVRSLKYCSDAVERIFSEWSSAQVGKTTGAAQPDAVEDEVERREHIERRLRDLERVSEELPQVLRGEIQRIIRKLAGLVVNPERPGLAKALDELEASLNTVIISNRKLLSTPETEKAVSSAIKRHRLSGDSAADAIDRLFCREVRKNYGIPRLSLYEL